MDYVKNSLFQNVKKHSNNYKKGDLFNVQKKSSLLNNILQQNNNPITDRLNVQKPIPEAEQNVINYYDRNPSKLLDLGRGPIRPEMAQQVQIQNQVSKRQEFQNNQILGAGPFIGTFMDTFKPTQALTTVAERAGADTQNNYSEIEAFKRREPVAASIAEMAGTFANYLLLGPVGEKAGKLATLGRTTRVGSTLIPGGATVSRMIPRAAKLGTVFGLNDFIGELFKQIRTGRYSLKDLATRTASGVGAGTAWGVGGSTLSPVKNVIGTGLTVAGADALETYIRKKKIEPQDWSKIIATGVAASLFETIGAKKRATKFKRGEFFDLGKEMQIKKVMSNTKESYEQAEKAVDTINALSGIPYGKGNLQMIPDSAYVETLNELPDSFYDLPKSEKYKYMDKVVKNIMKGDTVSDAFKSVVENIGKLQSKKPVVKKEVKTPKELKKIAINKLQEKNLSQKVSQFLYDNLLEPGGVFTNSNRILKNVDNETKKELSKFVSNKPITIYRGLTHKENSNLYNSKEISSWTTNKKIAQTYAKPTNGTIIKMTVNPKDILLELDKIKDKMKYALLQHPIAIQKLINQSEVLIKPGKYNIEIVNDNKEIKKIKPVVKKEIKREIPQTMIKERTLGKPKKTPSEIKIEKAFARRAELKRQAELENKKMKRNYEALQKEREKIDKKSVKIAKQRLKEIKEKEKPGKVISRKMTPEEMKKYGVKQASSKARQEAEKLTQKIRVQNYISNYKKKLLIMKRKGITESDFWKLYEKEQKEELNNFKEYTNQWNKSDIIMEFIEKHYGFDNEINKKPKKIKEQNKELKLLRKLHNMKKEGKSIEEFEKMEQKALDKETNYSEEKLYDSDIIHNFIVEQFHDKLYAGFPLPAFFQKPINNPDSTIKINVEKELDNWFGAVMQSKVKAKYIKKVFEKLAKRKNISKSRFEIIDRYLVNPKKYEKRLTPEEKSLAKTIRIYFDSLYKIANKSGILDSYIENYSMGIYKDNINKVKRILYPKGGKLGTKFQFAAKKKYSNPEEAEKDGLHPIWDPVLKAQIYTQSLFKVIANRKLIDVLKHMKNEDDIPLIMNGKNAPLNYEWIDSPAFNSYLYAGEQIKEGENKKTKEVYLIKVPMKVDPRIKKALLSISDNFMSQSFIVGYKKLRYFVLRLLLYNPLIHGWNIFSDVFDEVNFNILQAIKIVFGSDNVLEKAIKKKGYKSLEELENLAARAGVNLTSRSDIATELQDKISFKELDELNNEFIDKFPSAIKISANKLSKLSKWNDKILWENMVRHAQISIFALKRGQLLSKGLSEESANKAAAHFTNDLLGTMPSHLFTQIEREGLSIFFLARNWTISNLRLLTGATGTANLLTWNKNIPFLGGKPIIPNALRHKGLTEEELKTNQSFYIAHLIKGIIALIVFQNMIQFAIAKIKDKKFHTTFQNEKGHKFDIDLYSYDKKGRRRYTAGLLFRYIADYIHWAFDAPKTLLNKMEPLIKTQIQILLNYDEFSNQKIFKEGMTGREKWKTLFEFEALHLTPISTITGTPGQPFDPWESSFRLSGTWIRHGLVANLSYRYNKIKKTDRLEFIRLLNLKEQKKLLKLLTKIDSGKNLTEDEQLEASKLALKIIEFQQKKGYQKSITDDEINQAIYNREYYKALQLMLDSKRYSNIKGILDRFRLEMGKF